MGEPGEGFIPCVRVHTRVCVSACSAPSLLELPASSLLVFFSPSLDLLCSELTGDRESYWKGEGVVSVFQPLKSLTTMDKFNSGMSFPLQAKPSFKMQLCK